VSEADDVLRIEGLSTRFFTGEGQVNAVSDLDLTVRRGETVGIVGESGSGKSVTALSIAGLVDSPGRITAGSIEYRDPELAERVREGTPDAVDGAFVDLTAVPEAVRRSLRGNAFGMIFQDPESSFNPTLTVGEQIAEAVEVQRRATATPREDRARGEAYGFGSFLVDSLLPNRGFVEEGSMAKAIELLETVGIPDPAERAEEYPHQFSGGMLQRAMIAQALAGEPDVLVADEPTTALDVTIQAQVLDLLEELGDTYGMTTLLITHNLGVVARMCDRVGVMYAGELVERGTLEDVFDDPIHPYTQGLLGSLPEVDDAGGRLTPIEGNVPSLFDSEMEERCYFADRCPKAMEKCLEKPPEFDAGGEHATACYLADHGYDPADALPEGYFDE